MSDFSSTDTIVDHFITEACNSYILQLHRVVKIGESPSLEKTIPKNREEIFPRIYSNILTENTDNELEKYAVEQCSQTSHQQDHEDSQYSEDLTPRTEISEGVSTRQQHSQDIWGNIPLKEPKEMVECAVCNRNVAASKFAGHLDKCMSIGTMSRVQTASSSAASRSFLSPK